MPAFKNTRVTGGAPSDSASWDIDGGTPSAVGSGGVDGGGP